MNSIRHSTARSARAAAAGFTLIELMIVVAIIAILAAIGYPSYAEHVARSKRADAKAALMDAAQSLERQYTITNSYASGTLPTLSTSTGNNYTLSFGDASGAVTPTATAFKLRMVPKGPMASDKCGTFLLTNTGATDVTGNSGGATKTTCWEK